jgi:hypothetical protein
MWQTGYNVDAIIWSDIEAYTAVICSCLMAIRPLLMKCFPTLFPSTRPSAFDPGSGSSRARQTWGIKVGDMWSGSKINTGLNSGLNSTGWRSGHKILDERSSQESTIILQGARGAGKSVEDIELEETVRGREVVSAEDVGLYGGRR